MGIRFVWCSGDAEQIFVIKRRLERRRDLEHRILAEIFRENAMIVKAKGYEWRELEALI